MTSQSRNLASAREEQNVHRWLENLRGTIAWKLSTGFGLVLFLIGLFISGVTLSSLNVLNEQVSAMGDTADVSDLFHEIEGAFLEAHEAELIYILYGAQEEQARQDMIENEAAWKKLLAQLDTLTLHPETQETKNRLEIILVQVGKIYVHIRDVVEAGDIEAAKFYHSNQVEPLYGAIVNLFAHEIEPHIAQNKQATLASAQQAVRTSTTLIVGLAVGALGLGLVVSAFIANSISRPIRHLTHAAQAITGGNLEIEVCVKSRDETSILAAAFNQMVARLREMLFSEQEQRERLQTVAQQYVSHMAKVGRGNLAARVDVVSGAHGADDVLAMLGHQLNQTTTNLQKMIAQIRAAAGQLDTAAVEILAATTQQASGASQQAAAISQTSTTVDEVKVISEQATTRAQEVSSAAQRTVEVSRSGQKAVADTIESMGQIQERVEGIAENILTLSEQIQQIEDIIATVNDIASQSNILALNASIEAARAGEHGKGFAIVAVEVRNLAEQSKQATAQVKSILSEIQRATDLTVMATKEGTKGVAKGAATVAQARQAIDQLSRVITESAQAAAQMVAGGRQQAAGIEQIALAMQNINQATVQSLSSTRQAEKAAQELNELARSLTETVAQYL